MVLFQLLGLIEKLVYNQLRISLPTSFFANKSKSLIAAFVNFCLSLCEEKMKLSIWENIRLIFQQKCCTKNRPMFSFSFSIQDKKLLFDSISTKHLKETLIKIRIITRVSFNCFLGGLYNLLHYLTRHHITNVSINYIFCNVNLKLKS